MRLDAVSPLSCRPQDPTIQPQVRTRLWSARIRRSSSLALAQRPLNLPCALGKSTTAVPLTSELGHACSLLGFLVFQSPILWLGSPSCSPAHASRGFEPKLANSVRPNLLQSLRTLCVQKLQVDRVRPVHDRESDCKGITWDTT